MIDVTGRAAIREVLQLSAVQAAGGEPQQGKRRAGEVVFDGHQASQVFLSDRRLGVERPKLRTKGPKSQEVEVPAYAAMQNRTAMGARMLHGVSRASTRKSSRPWKIQIIYIDGLIFGDYTMVGVVGVDTHGIQGCAGHPRGCQGKRRGGHCAAGGDIVARGVDPQCKMLFAIDGSKALRAAINAVFGADQPVQRCRAHKLCNVLGYLPKDDQAQVKSMLRAAWKLPAKEGIARIRKLAAWLDEKYPSAASLLEGLEECFTSTSWTSRLRCTAAWLPPTSSRARAPECASRLAALLTGRTARWCCDGWPQHSSEQRSDSTASWGTTISGLWKLSSPQ